MNNSIKIGYLYLVLGILMVFGGFFVTKNTSDFIDGALSSKGTVIELIQKEDSLYPKIEFQDETQKSHTFKSSFGCSPACYKEQEQVAVLYSSGEIKNPRINSFMSLWLPSLLLFGIGISFVIASLFQIKKLKRSMVQSVT
jgi:hypothetical protein